MNIIWSLAIAFVSIISIIVVCYAYAMLLLVIANNREIKEREKNDLETISHPND